MKRHEYISGYNYTPGHVVALLSMSPEIFKILCLNMGRLGESSNCSFESTTIYGCHQ